VFRVSRLIWEILAAQTCEERVAARSLEWLAANAGDFLPRPDTAPSEAALTALAEMALLVGQTAGLRGGRPKPEREREYVQRLAAAALHSFGTPHVLGFYRTGPAEAGIGLLVTWLGLRAYDSERSLSKDAVAAFVRERQVERPERSPMRKMELRWVLDGIGLAHRLPPMRVLLEASLPRDVVEHDAGDMTEAEIYGFTHTVFYGTDYGRALRLFEETGLTVLSRAHALLLLERMQRKEHWDLTAELVLAYRCLGGGAAAAVDGAWRALSAAQAADGSFPAADEAPIRDEPHPRRNWALRRYHVCLAAALAAFVPPRQP